MAVFQYYKDKGSRWRWRLRNDEGKIIAVSGEGFISKDECLEDLDTARQLSDISEVRIYESEEDFSVYKEAPDSESTEEPVSDETPDTEPEPDVESELEMVPDEEFIEEPEFEAEPEPEIEPELNEIDEPEEEPIEEAEEETLQPPPEPIEQPDDIPSLMEESSYTSAPEKWKKPNWALITSIAALVIIIVMIILLSLKKKPESEPVMLEIIPETEEQVPSPEMVPEPVEEEIPIITEEPDTIIPEQEIAELKTHIESPELNKVPEPIPMDIIHKVVKGDRLWSLADEYYSDAYLWPTIYNANTKKIRNPDLIRIGIELLIPALEGNKLKLSDSDRQKVARGYVRAYLIYKQLGKKDAIYYLFGAYFYAESVLAEFQGQINPKDIKVVKTYKKK